MIDRESKNKRASERRRDTEATNFCTERSKGGRKGRRERAGEEGPGRLSQAKNVEKRGGRTGVESRARMVNSCWCACSGAVLCERAPITPISPLPARARVHSFVRRSSGIKARLRRKCMCTQGLICVFDRGAERIRRDGGRS